MTAKPQSYAFGEFVFESGGMRLLQNGTPLPFTRQSAEVLRYLIENRDRVVTRIELIEQFWATAPIGADDRLNTCIRRIRAVLDGAQTSASAIETSPRLGYRFVASVEAVQTKSGSWFERALNWLRISPLNLAGATAICAAALTPFVFFSLGNSQLTPDSVYRGHGYELQKYGDLNSTCEFEKGTDIGECAISGDGYVRFLYKGKEIMRTDVPVGAVLTSNHNEGRIQFKLSTPSS